MRKISIFLSAAAFVIACPSLMAQNSPTQVISHQDNTAVNLGNGGLIYNSLPPGVNLLKNAIKNPDGSMTIKAGQQTPEANEINRQYCESLGGIDITNESDQTIGAGTLYAVVCKKAPDVTDTNLNPFSRN